MDNVASFLFGMVFPVVGVLILVVGVALAAWALYRLAAWHMLRQVD